MATPEPPNQPDTLGALRADVNDLAQTMGEQLGAFAHRLDAVESGEQHVVRIVQGQKLTITPEDCVLILLPGDAFTPMYEGDEAIASMIARVAADVLGTRRVLVIEDTAQIHVAPLPPEGGPTGG